MNTRRVLQIVAWVVLAGLVFSTIGPVDLRPSLGLPLKVERFVGFAIVAALFVWAYPRRWIAIMAILSAAAVGLELLQFVAPGRDPSPVDAVVKIIGAVVGSFGARVIERLASKWHVARD
jgi:hypothetical protein